MSDTDLVTSGYRSLEGTFDELVDDRGQVRPHWAGLLGALEELGPDELQRRSHDIARLLAGDGVTYRVYGDDNSSDAWSLDPVPLLVDSADWSRIEHGLTERAEVLNVVLEDLYGPRDLVRRGLIPPEVVVGQRGFLRPLVDSSQPRGRSLTFYAADLGRDAEGTMRVLADFTGAPSGTGYALENRSVLSRVFPSLYREAQVHRLAPFFRAMRAALTRAAPPGVDDPRVVLLTPGPLNETYFEHAMLARHLGYALVEGSDLVVREGRVWMRSLSGLEPVDVIMRRVDGWYCDPLELKPDSRLGVVGLVEACRRGTVSVVNPLGSAVLESPGLMAFLPRVAEHVLGRPPRLEQLPGWWCGRRPDRSHVLAHLDELTVTRLDQLGPTETVVGWELPEAGLDDLRRRIEADPSGFVAQGRIECSSAPTLGPAGLVARPAVLRAFAVAREESYLLLPGGLTRVGPAPATLLVSNQAGAISKDTWVLASEPEPQTSFWLRRGTVEASDPAGILPARTAENLFWLGRYAERSENTVRLVRVVLERRNDFQAGASPAGTVVLAELHAALSLLTGISVGGDETNDSAAFWGLLDVVADPERPGTLAFDLSSMVACAHAVRDQLSNDTWLTLADIDSTMRAVTATKGRTILAGGLSSVMRGLLAFAGLTAESHVRDPGWAFLDAGRRLERSVWLASLLSETLRAGSGTAEESLMLESVLVASESIITYRRRYRSQAQVETLLDLLLLDEANPRSMIFQLDSLERDLAALPAGHNTRLREEQRVAVELATRVRLADTVALAKVDDSGERRVLADFLDGTSAQLRRLGDSIDAGHFAPGAPGHFLTGRELDTVSDWDSVLP